MGCAIGFRKGLATIAGASKKTLNQPLVLPRKPAEQNGDFAAFLLAEGKLMGAQARIKVECLR
jgi:hypothetical protein